MDKAPDDDEELMATEYIWLAVFEELSVAIMVKLYVDAAVGVPVIAPELLRESPDGSVPPDSAQV